MIENIFGLNGIGKVYFDALNGNDNEVILALQMFYVSISLFGNLIIDLVYGLVDPRIRVNKTKEAVYGKEKQQHCQRNGVFSTLGNWFRRTFRGGSKEMSDDEKLTAIEKIESPSVMATKAFFRRKLAVVALVVLIGMFLFVFIGPYCVPMDLNYTDPLHGQRAPINNMKTVPEELEEPDKGYKRLCRFHRWRKQG